MLSGKDAAAASAADEVRILVGEGQVPCQDSWSVRPMPGPAT